MHLRACNPMYSMHLGVHDPVYGVHVPVYSVHPGVRSLACSVCLGVQALRAALRSAVCIPTLPPSSLAVLCSGLDVCCSLWKSWAG